MWLRTLAVLGLRPKQTSLQGVAGLTKPLEGWKKKTEVPNSEGILPPSVMQNPCLSFPTPWVTQCIRQFKKSSQWMPGSYPGVS